MIFDKIREIIKKFPKKLPPGISFGVGIVSVDPGTVSQHYLSQLSFKDQDELLKELKKLSEEQFKRLGEELENERILSKEQFTQVVKLLEENIQSHKNKILKSCFRQVDDVFEHQISKNFLYEYEWPTYPQRLYT
ncbi:MAG: hypothetical protein QME57_04920 [Patescibacteria group bacterium]|nr:hypothetical protein [Patescibacteria group bacterium]